MKIHNHFVYRVSISFRVYIANENSNNNAAQRFFIDFMISRRETKLSKENKRRILVYYYSFLNCRAKSRELNF